MLSSFQDKNIKKVEELGGNNVSSKYSLSCTKRKNPFGGTRHVGRWFYWGGTYQWIPEDLVFSNKMTLQSACHRYYLLDHESGATMQDMNYFLGTLMCETWVKSWGESWSRLATRLIFYNFILIIIIVSRSLLFF